jgi:hypothetical protein
VLHRLLLLPLLSPLLVTLLVAALNPSPSIRLRLLTWQSPALPIGLWMAMAAGGGAALSGGATALALRQGGSRPLRRTVRRSEPWEDAGWSPPRSGRGEPQRPFASPPEPSGGPPAAAGPSRGAGEPAPTVSVPFRVLRRPEAVDAGSPRPARPSPPSPPSSQPRGHAHGHGVAVQEPDWGETESEDW